MFSIRCHHACILAMLASLLLPSIAAAANLDYVGRMIYPQVGQRGTSVEVTLIGAFLQDPQAVLFYQPGIRCTKLEPITDIIDFRQGTPSKADPGTAARLTFEIAKDAPVGEYQFRVRTHDALSEMMTFWVTSFPVVNEANPWQDRDYQGEPIRNDARRFAQHIPLNVSVSGYVPTGTPQDYDWYSVDCEAGQRLSIEVVAARLGTWHYAGMNDPAVHVFDSDGNEIARNDDNGTFGQDSALSVTIPATGRYFIVMRQTMDYETLMRHYIMHVGTFARPFVVYPLGGQAGRTVPFSFISDVTGKQIKEVKLPSEVGPFEASYFHLRASDDQPTPNRIHVAPFSDVFEQPGHRSADNAQVIGSSLPFAINGIIESEGETDWYRITAKRGERFRVRTYAKTLDSELDPKIILKPAPGNDSRRTYDEDDTRWEPHDLVGHHYREQIKDRLDPIFMFEPDTDGDWLLGITDTRRESGPMHSYRIEFQPHVDSAFVYFPAYPSQAEIVRDRITVHRGHAWSRPLGVQAGFGSTYNKPLRLRAINLPNGVTMDCPPFKQCDGVIPILFKADSDAAVGASTVDLVVEPVDPADRPNFRGGFIQVNPATQRRGGYAMYFNQTRKLAVAVVEGACFDVSIEQPRVPLAQHGELGLTVNIKRYDDFDEAVYLEMDWLPQNINKQPPLIIAKGQTTGTYKLSARSTATPGTHPISINAREYGGGVPRTGAGFHYVASPYISLQVSEPYVTMVLNRSAIERGKVGEITAQIKHHKPFEGTAKLMLGRLPFGVKQVDPVPTIQAGETTATFKVEVTADCLISQYKEIYCEVELKVGDQTIRQQTGNGVLRVDPERK